MPGRMLLLDRVAFKVVLERRLRTLFAESLTPHSLWPALRHITRCRRVGGGAFSPHIMPFGFHGEFKS